MLANKIIEEDNGPTLWQLPMVIVHKENGSIRICTDGRPLKEAIIRSRTAPVTINDVRHQLNGSKYFSKIDLKNGYFQIPLDEESRKYTTFATHRGNYRYLRLNMGLSCSAEIFQREIARLLKGIKGQINISDDILIFAENEIEHDRILDEVMQRIEDSGLTINIDKSIFKVQKLKFFGMIFSEDGISPDPDKVKSIQAALPPNDQTELKSFLGMTQFVAGFITDYSTKSAPLYDMLKQSNKFIWNANHEQAFKTLKDDICTKATAYYNPNWPTTLICDSSGIGIGAILTQQDPDNKGNNVIIESHSRVLTEIEQRYSAIEKESGGWM